MKLLIVYGTTEGQTRKIARYMEDVLQDAGHKVTIADVTEEPPAPARAGQPVAPGLPASRPGRWQVAGERVGQRVRQAGTPGRRTGRPVALD